MATNRRVSLKTGPRVDKAHIAFLRGLAKQRPEMHEHRLEEEILQLQRREAELSSSILRRKGLTERETLGIQLKMMRLVLQQARKTKALFTLLERTKPGKTVTVKAITGPQKISPKEAKAILSKSEETISTARALIRKTKKKLETLE